VRDNNETKYNEKGSEMDIKKKSGGRIQTNVEIGEKER
jgi:hypothetical protein